MKQINRLYFLFVGLGLLIISIVLDLGFLSWDQVKNVPVLVWVLTVISKILSTVGLSIVIGHFTAKIKMSEKIEDIFSSKQKVDIINNLICEGNKLDEYKKSILANMRKSKSNYRTNVVYKLHVYKDKTEKIVCSNIRISYVEHRVEKGVDSIISYFDRDETETKFIKISNPDNLNDSVILKSDKIKKEKSTAFSSDLEYTHKCIIPKRFKRMEKLVIEKEIVFKGQDHWINCAMIFMCPHHGISFTLNTEDGLVIKEDTIFGDNQSYSKEFSKEKPNTITLSSNSWLSGYHGFSIIVAESEASDSK